MATGGDREALAGKLDQHVEDEGRILAEYRKLAENLGDSPLARLVNLILTEEEVHHLLFRTTAQWLRDPSAETEISAPSEAEREGLLRRTEELKRHEQETIAACGDLKSSLSGESGVFLDSLMQAMVVDSEKHHRLLESVEKLLKTG